MKFNEFIGEALRTESTYNPLVDRVVEKGLSNRTFHSILGISTEINELENAINEFDIPNVVEELGDIMWYLAVFVDDNNLDVKKLEDAFDVIKDKNTKLFKFEPMKNMVAETMDLCKKTMFYNREFDLDYYYFARNIILGVGSIIKKSKQFDIEKIMDTVINKLKVRYPDKFKEDNAENRNLNMERKVLEESVSK